MKSYLAWLGVGIVLGVLLAFAVFGGNRQEQAHVVLFQPEQEGETLPTRAEMALMQAGGRVGHLTPGARLWLQPDAEPARHVQLLLEWEDDGTFDTVFLPVADDGTPAARKALATLETHN